MGRRVKSCGLNAWQGGGKISNHQARKGHEGLGTTEDTESTERFREMAFDDGREVRAWSRRISAAEGPVTGRAGRPGQGERGLCGRAGDFAKRSQQPDACRGAGRVTVRKERAEAPAGPVPAGSGYLKHNCHGMFPLGGGSGPGQRDPAGRAGHRRAGPGREKRPGGQGEDSEAGGVTSITWPGR